MIHAILTTLFVAAIVIGFIAWQRSEDRKLEAELQRLDAEAEAMEAWHEMVAQDRAQELGEIGPDVIFTDEDGDTVEVYYGPH